jgi:hypothetical protein
MYRMGICRQVEEEALENAQGNTAMKSELPAEDRRRERQLVQEREDVDGE